MRFSELTKIAEKLVVQASFYLPGDVRNLLVRAEQAEKNKKAKKALGWIIDNADIARKDKVAICQDTGLPVIFIELGKDLTADLRLVKAIEKGVERGYRRNFLRPSIIDPLKRGSSFYKGCITHLGFHSGKGLKISVFPKGFGSENKSRLRMFNPTADLEGITSFVVESVKKAGPQACPPFVVGVGIGGTSDQALLLAKQALIPRIDRAADKFEQQLLKKINSLNIGAMGLGGKITALAVRVKTAPTHIAGLPVGVNISCHALRKASIHLK